MAEDFPRETEDKITTLLTPEEEEVLNDLILHEDEFFLMLSVISSILNQLDEFGEDE